MVSDDLATDHTRLSDLMYINMALYKYPGYETGQRWTMKPRNLEGIFWGEQ